MTFLANPCACGYSCDEVEENKKKICRACNRIFVKESWGWNQITKLEFIKDVKLCAHKRIIEEEFCPHCKKKEVKI